MSNIVSTISKESANRLMKDIKDITKNSLNSEGIFYKHDTENMLKGYAMIIGPAYGLYANGIYFFLFHFPTDYPFTPPTVEYCTNDGTTRFNPNLYRQGKVCLSILNTWPGDSWTSCQSIRSVLLQLLLLFNDTPLLNEPGVTKMHSDYNSYHEIIQFKNIEYSIYQQLYFKNPIVFTTLFDKEIKTHIKEAFSLIYEDCQRLIKENSIAIVKTTKLYRMAVTVDYPTLLEKIVSLKEIF